MIPNSYQLELRHIRYFLAVADELHFRRAAERLYISQPGLSRQIRQMEEGLGLRLFERHNRKVSLTPAGSYLQKEWSQITQHLDRAVEHAKLLHTGHEGSLQLGYIGSAMHRVIPDFLLQLRNTSPNIHIDLQEMDNQTQVKALKDGKIDVGFVRMDRAPRDIQMRAIYEETFSLVLPREHEITPTTFTSLAQLKDESFIMFDASYSPSYYEKVMKIFDDAGFQPIISHRSVKANTIYRLIENHFGVAIVPTSLKEGYDLNIKFIELTDIPDRTTLQAIWKNNNPNPILPHVLNLIR